MIASLRSQSRFARLGGQRRKGEKRENSLREFDFPQITQIHSYLQDTVNGFSQITQINFSNPRDLREISLHLDLHY